MKRRISIFQISFVIVALVVLIGSAQSADLNYWKVVYSLSSTEGGSSGSALLNDSLQITGQLTGGNAYCGSVNSPYYYDVYGKFSASWDLGLSDYLDNGKKSGEIKSVPAIKSPMRAKKGPELISSPGLTLKAPFKPASSIVLSDSKIAEAHREFEIQAAASGKRKVIGVHIDTPEFVEVRWEQLRDEQGNQSWRTAIKAPKAKSLRLHFSKFQPGAGDQVIVYSELSPKTARRVGPTRTATTSDFWGPITKGDLVFLEVVTKSTNPPLIVVDKISYAVKEMFSADEFFKVGDCYEDPNCYPDWDGAKDAIGQMVFDYQGGQAVCTGSLIRDVAGSLEPFFFSANHCFHSQATADSLIVTFFWYTNACDGTVADWNDVPFTHGSDVLVYSSETDALLLRLDGDLPDGSVFLGWDANENYALDDEISVLHHPAGTHMRISFGYISGESDGSEVDFGDDDDDDDYDDDDDNDNIGTRDSGDDDDDECGIFCG